ncbi:MAG: response regulator transcription factor [Lewinellaceae bacterium]|nr:response regulator transcription factor [Lewinellaceae bacterium]
MRAVIIEDSPNVVELLTGYLRAQSPEVELAGVADSLETAEALVLQEEPGLLFLDIQIKRGTAFDLLHRLREAGKLQAQLVFITGHGSKENAVRALQYSALDFIEKPIDPARLREAVSRALAREQDKSQLVEQVSILFDNLRQPCPTNGTLAVPMARGAIEVACIEDISWIESDGQVCHLHLQDGQKLTAMRNIGHFRNILVPDYSFFPVSQSNIVNVKYVRRFEPAQLLIIMRDGTQLETSRRGGADFRKYLLSQSPSTEKQKNTVVEWFRRIFRA